jgi:tRNA-specific 2-thiouridylase
MARVVVGLSGGVDSSVAAYLLQQQGHEVIGVFMRNWHDDSVTINNECPWIEDSNDALLVAQQLGIPFQTLDLSDGYKQRIVDYMFAEYKAGRTPNPDVLCNREIKYDLFLKAAKQLGAEFVATGHYCQKATIMKEGEEIHRLLAGADPNKDQSYFLCQLSQEQLKYALFPIGHLQKPEVREIAREIGLDTANKKDSQGLCFIGKVRLPEFLQQKLYPKQGDVVEILPKAVPKLIATSTYTTANRLAQLTAPPHLTANQGKVIGQHPGAHFFTVGQRRGLQIGGRPEPMFVLGTDTNKNIIYVGQGEQHPQLHREGLFVADEDVHFVRKDLALKPGEQANYQVRIRYRQVLQKARLVRETEGLYVLFDTPQKAVAAGQFIAWYASDELIGSGVIA